MDSGLKKIVYQHAPPCINFINLRELSGLTKLSFLIQKMRKVKRKVK